MDKFKNFLYYEWKKIIAIAAIASIIIVTAVQCNNKVVTDLGVLYIGRVNPGDIAGLEASLKESQLAKDADSDGLVTVKARTILVSADEDINMEQQVYEQIQVELVSGQNRLFLTDEAVLLTNAKSYSFADIGFIAQKLGINPENCKAYEDGTVYAISLEGNSYLESLGIPTQNMFIAQRNYTDELKNDQCNINASNAIEYILKENTHE